jgi:hypothetical protein
MRRICAPRLWIACWSNGARNLRSFHSGCSITFSLAKGKTEVLVAYILSPSFLLFIRRLVFHDLVLFFRYLSMHHGFIIFFLRLSGVVDVLFRLFSSLSAAMVATINAWTLCTALDSNNNYVCSRSRRVCTRRTATVAVTDKLNNALRGRIPV